MQVLCYDCVDPCYVFVDLKSHQLFCVVKIKGQLIMSSLVGNRKKTVLRFEGMGVPSAQKRVLYKIYPSVCVSFCINNYSIDINQIRIKHIN